MKMLRVDMQCPACGDQATGVGLLSEGPALVWVVPCGCDVVATVVNGRVVLAEAAQIVPTDAVPP